MPQIFRDPDETPEERRAGVVEALKSILGRYDVTFSFSESPKTDGKTVWLGNLDPDDESFETFALGHGIHEMMHVTQTDMSAFAAKEKTELTAGLINVLEDVRIDTYGMRLNRLYGVWRPLPTRTCRPQHFSARGFMPNSWPGKRWTGP